MCVHMWHAMYGQVEGTSRASHDRKPVAGEQLCQRPLSQLCQP